MILATTRIKDFDSFLKTFTTRGAEKRRQHGSKGSIIFRDPNEEDRVWVVFDWDEKGWDSFLSDPDAPSVFNAAGLKEKPQAAIFNGKYDA